MENNRFNFCPECGSKKIQTLLNGRQWFCPDCGLELFNNVASAVVEIKPAIGTKRMLVLEIDVLSAGFYHMEVDITRAVPQKGHLEVTHATRAAGLFLRVVLTRSILPATLTQHQQHQQQDEDNVDRTEYKSQSLHTPVKKIRHNTCKAS